MVRAGNMSGPGSHTTRLSELLPGAPYVKVHAGEKKPVEDDWPNLPPLTAEDLQAQGWRGNVGVQTGVPGDLGESFGCVDIDIDTEGEREKIEDRFPWLRNTTRITHAGTPHRAKYLLILGSGTFESNHSEKVPGWKVEMFAKKGRQVVVFGTYAAYDGARLQHNDKPVAVVDADDWAELYAYVKPERTAPEPPDEPPPAGKRRYPRYSLNTVQDMAGYYPPPDTYDDFVALMLALKSAGREYADTELYAVFDSICQRGERYDQEDNLRHWQGAKPDGRRGFGSFVKLCQNGGWKGAKRGRRTRTARPPSGRTVLYPTLEDMQRGLELLGTTVRFNVLLGGPQVRADWLPESGWMDTGTKDLNVAALRQRFVETFVTANDEDQELSIPWHSQRGAWAQTFKALLAYRQVNPFLDYVQSLEWDRKSRLDSWLERVYRVDPKQLRLVQHVSKALLIAPIRRNVVPGSDQKWGPVLISRQQSLGKSAILRRLLYQDGRWFADGLDYRAAPKELAEALSGVVLAEFDEAQGLSSTSLGRVKSIMSRSGDKARGAYDEFASVNLRRCLFVITTNQSGASLPADPSGHTRFAPVVLDKGADESLDEHWDNLEAVLAPSEVDQLWAEAWERQGEDLTLRGDLAGLAQSEADEQAAFDVTLLEAIQRAWQSTELDDVKEASAGQLKRLVETDLGNNAKVSDTKLSLHLQQLCPRLYGGKQRKRNGVRSRWYGRPHDG